MRGDAAVRKRRVADAVTADGTEDCRRGDQRRTDHQGGEKGLSEHAPILGVPLLGPAPRCAAVSLPDPRHTVRNSGVPKL